MTRQLILKLACAGLFQAFITPAIANYDLGLAAYQRGDFESAYHEWLDVTMSPEDSVHPAVMAETCYALGMLFWVGQGVPQNTDASARWLLRAAELGHPGAQTKLGYLYGAGHGVPQSDYEAFKWTQMAAQQGDVDAQYNLGVFYRDGKGVPANTQMALEWFHKAADAGDRVSADVIANYELRGWPVAAETVEEAPINLAASEDSAASSSNGAATVTAIETAAPHAESVKDSITELVSPLAASEAPPAVPGESEMQPDNRLDELWIRAREPEHYTIQIIALLDKSKLLDFIDQHPELEPFATYQQEWKGKPLWVLLQGDYADVELARAAASAFPEGIQKRDQLWIRRFGMVQGLLLDSSN